MKQILPDEALTMVGTMARQETNIKLDEDVK